MIETLPPLGKYKYDTWRILLMKCYIDNFERLWSYIQNVNTDLVTEILEHGTIEILGIIDGDLLRNSTATDNILLEKYLDGGGGYIGYRCRFNPCGEVLHYDDGEGVISLCWCKFAHNIDGPLLQGPGWSYQL
jgi:hypothetical protein